MILYSGVDLLTYFGLLISLKECILQTMPIIELINLPSNKLIWCLQAYNIVLLLYQDLTYESKYLFGVIFGAVKAVKTVFRN